jgi:hypothetical protein
MIRKSLLALVLVSAAFAAPLSLASPVAAADYAAIAAGVNGVGWVEGGYRNMEAARAAAVRGCRDLGGSCSVSTAEESYWFFSAGYCNGVPYTAASPQGPRRSEELVRRKGAADGNYDCYIHITF